MALIEKRIDELEKAATPLMMRLEKNCHPHVPAIEVLEVLAIASRMERQLLDE